MGGQRARVGITAYYYGKRLGVGLTMNGASGEILATRETRARRSFLSCLESV